MSATLTHLKSSHKLRADNLAFCADRLKEVARMIDVLSTSGARTFGEAIRELVAHPDAPPAEPAGAAQAQEAA